MPPPVFGGQVLFHKYCVKDRRAKTGCPPLKLVGPGLIFLLAVKNYFRQSILRSMENRMSSSFATGARHEVICIGCGKKPAELAEYVEMAEIEDMTPDDYVRSEEGTYNRDNGHFLCSPCYVDAGMPSSPRGWVAP
jgi:hypothetical protein